MNAHLRWMALGLALFLLGGLGAAVTAAEPADRGNTVHDLLAALKSDDWAERYRAAEALGEMGSRAVEAVPALLAALKDKQHFVRAQAALALGRIGSPRRGVVPALIKALKDSEAAVRENAAKGLGALGAEAGDAAQALRGLRDDPDYVVQAAASAALEKVDAPLVATQSETIDDGTAPAIFSPDGKLLVTRGADEGQVCLWDVPTWALRRTLRGATLDPLLPVVFSPDRRLLAAADGAEHAKIWEVATGKAKATIQGKSRMVAPLAFSADGKTLAVVDLPFAETWGDDRGLDAEAERRMEHKRAEADVLLWDVATGRQRRSGADNKLPTVIITVPQGEGHLDVRDHRVTLRMIADGKARGRLSVSREDLFIAYGAGTVDIRTEDGALRAVVRGVRDSEGVKVSNKRTKNGFLLRGQLISIHSLAFSANGSILAAADISGNVQLWESATGKPLVTIREEDGGIHSDLTLSPDGKVVVVGRAGKAGLKVWDVGDLIDRRRKR